ncbi:hypothetical protein KSK37_10125 [Kaistella sp. DKR-2]|uniref:hypothetical protein n=1 Tax=Kaistella soli TaxID=2849654 RepID=UPI001C25A39D|nr:hypothetical protein [Kaistella soli]MBU8883439.1 hypothetical protein [Kaistella soli]
MRNLYAAVFALLIMNSCNKEEINTQNQAEITKPASTEISQVQEPLKLKNSKGEELSVTYLAEGDVVGVKIQKTGEGEQKLSAKTTNLSGNPIFSNENYMWEMTHEGKAGKLSDKDGNASEYQ